MGASPVVASLPGAVPFGFSFDTRGRLVAAEAGPNAVVSLTVNRDGALTQNSEVATGQKATCRIVIDGQYVYASNAGYGTLSEFTLGQSGSLTAGVTTATDAGTINATGTPDGQFVCVQTGAAGIVDEFAVTSTGGLTRIGAVTVPGAAGGEGICAS